MSAEDIGKAADDDVVNAFQVLPDATGWDNPKTWRKGGNIQLSRSFAEFSKLHPGRAIEIINKFTPEIGARASGYAIEAMAETVGGDVLLPLVQNLEKRGFSSDEYRSGVARAIEKLLNRKYEIDDATLVIVEEWLGEPAIEEKTEVDVEEINESDAGQPEVDKNKRRQSILWGLGGMTILPHGNFPILEVITRIYLHRKHYDELIQILRSHLKRDEEEGIWKALLQLFPFIHTEKKALLADFYRELFKKYPHLSETHEAAILLAQIHWTVPNVAFEILSKLEKSEVAFAQQAFGELAVLIWLMRDDLSWPKSFVDNILAREPSSPMRTGAAFAAINVWAEMPDKERAPALIRDLANNAGEETWSAIIDIFRLVDEVTPDPDWVVILRAIADEVPKQGSFMSSFVIERLQTLLPHQAELVAKIAIALVEKWSFDLGDLRTSHASVAPEVVDIAITLHRLSARTRELGLEIFERLLTINAYTARETLDQIDNRFRPGQPVSRRRLPRRVMSPRRGRRRTAA
jgi:hypothetical protein